MKFYAIPMILFATLAYGDVDVNHRQDIARRPYTAPVASETMNGEVVNGVENPEVVKNRKTLYLHQLGRRPYMEKSVNEPRKQSVSVE